MNIESGNFGAENADLEEEIKKQEETTRLE